MRIKVPELSEIVMRDGDDQLKQELTDIFNFSTTIHLEKIIKAHWKWQKREYAKGH